MSKKTKSEAPLHAGNGVTLPTNPGSLSIKDVVVADPSVEFTVDLDGFDGISYLQDFEVQLSISASETLPPGKFSSLGRIVVSTLSLDKGAYFYFTFGDPDYKPGTVYTMCMWFTAYNPQSGMPITFDMNPVMIKVVGGGQIS
jgi:hypothetical protein